MIPIAENSFHAEAHWNVVSTSIRQRIIRILDKDKPPIRKWKQKPILSTELEAFLSDLLEDNHLETFIKTPPSELGSLILSVHARMSDSVNRTEKKSLEPDYLILYSIFVDYGYNRIDNLDFINRLEIDSCPYCNRNYILTLNRAGKIKPEIDHFYPKGIYPFLGACYYNLIPSCQTCNGFGGKGSEDTFVRGVKSPYEIIHEDFHFSFEPVDLDYANPIVPKGVIDIQLNTTHTANSDLFKLDALFKKHEDHVLELIIKSKLEYSAKYREALIDFDEHLFSYEEINRLIVGNYTEKVDLHKRPLSKLYRDIAIDLGLIKNESI